MQAGLVDGVLPVSVKAVNQRTGVSSLDFRQHQDHGLRVIVVGGNRLSRGLTLEGLTVSYFYRLTKMYDSLLPSSAGSHGLADRQRWTDNLYSRKCLERQGIRPCALFLYKMKLPEVTAETNGKYTPLIARYANSQNKVSDADFFSNHEFHQRMEQISHSLRAPAMNGVQYGTHWRYERARGSYMNEQAKLTPAQKNLFKLQNPSDQLITKVDLAKFENAWRFLPNIVSQGAQKNFITF